MNTIRWTTFILLMNPVLGIAGDATSPLIGQWHCLMSYAGVTVGETAVVFSTNGKADIGGEPFTYSISDSANITLADGSDSYEYHYQFNAAQLQLDYSDGSRFDCQRTEVAPAAPATATKDRSATASREQGQVWQLHGDYCSWSGSSSGGSSYSRTQRIHFDGNGRWTMGSESSFSGDAGLAYGGQANQASGSYQVVGKQIRYVTHSGEAGIAEVNMQQSDGRITELMIDGTLFAPQLCQ
ncbi:MAG: hypothetical protein HQL49_09270 [Gammaproteobacteria bacterium]|nr:hypothetical protein [Gammaproteobacteria bacterium]